MVNFSRSKQAHQQSKGSQSIFFGYEGRSKLSLTNHDLGAVWYDEFDLAFDPKSKRLYGVCNLRGKYFLRAWDLNGRRVAEWSVPRQFKPYSLLWGSEDRILLALQHEDDSLKTTGKYRLSIGSFKEGTLKDFTQIESEPLKIPDNDPRWKATVETVRQRMRETGFEPSPTFGAKTASLQSSVDYFSVIARPLSVGRSTWTEDLSTICFAPRLFVLPYDLHVCRKQTNGTYKTLPGTNRLFEMLGISIKEVLYNKRVQTLSIEVSPGELLLSLAISDSDESLGLPFYTPYVEELPPPEYKDQLSSVVFVVLWLDITRQKIEYRRKESGLIARTLKRY